MQYVIGGDAENGKSIKQLYSGSQRKLEDQKVRRERRAKKAKKGEINRLVGRSRVHLTNHVISYSSPQVVVHAKV